MQVAATEEAFEIAQLNQKNMLDFRFLATVALMFTLDSVFLVGLVAAGIAIIVCVNPIAGVAVMLSTLLAFSLLHLFIAHDSRKFTSWVESFTNIAGAIDVGPADELFPEPYQLIR